jgi:hypothetical protein
MDGLGPAEYASPPCPPFSQGRRPACVAMKASSHVPAAAPPSSRGRRPLFWLDGRKLPHLSRWEAPTLGLSSARLASAPNPDEGSRCRLDRREGKAAVTPEPPSSGRGGGRRLLCPRKRPPGGPLYAHCPVFNLPATGSELPSKHVAVKASGSHWGPRPRSSSLDRRRLVPTAAALLWPRGGGGSCSA